MAVGMCALLLAMPMAPEAVTATNSDFGSVDGSGEGPGSLTRTFAISGAGVVTDVDILIDFSKCGGPAPDPTDTRCLGTGPSFNSEIVFQLTSPNGTTVNLVTPFDDETESSTYTGQTPGARVTVTFDDETPVQVGGQSLQFGRFQPADVDVGGLAALNGPVPDGLWTLTVQDTAGGDPLQFYSATLCINEPCPAITSLIIGDVNASDARDAVDARLLLQVLVGVNPPAAIHVTAAGDVNVDGIIDNRDASLILALTTGRVLPPPEPSLVQAIETANGTVITGAPGAVPLPVLPGTTVNLFNIANGATDTSIPVDAQGSFRGPQAPTFVAVAGDTVAVNINDSPARAAILVQQPSEGGEGSALGSLTQ